VSTHLDHFRFIVPCGITDKGVTSLKKLISRPVAMAEVEAALVRAFRQIFI
jgi:lipoyl(octanoyl) transferase